MSDYKIEVGDITKFDCDCIVNAANGSLMGAAWMAQFTGRQGVNC